MPEFRACQATLLGVRGLVCTSCLCVVGVVCLDFIAEALISLGYLLWARGFLGFQVNWVAQP